MAITHGLRLTRTEVYGSLGCLPSRWFWYLIALHSKLRCGFVQLNGVEPSAYVGLQRETKEKQRTRRAAIVRRKREAFSSLRPIIKRIVSGGEKICAASCIVGLRVGRRSYIDVVYTIIRGEFVKPTTRRGSAAPSPKKGFTKVRVAPP